MSKTVIKFEGVSKKFSRNIRRAMFYGLKDLVFQLLGISPKVDLRPTEFWALKNVSFDLKKGESLGFIGHNGAGKTTSLKLINGLIAPDEGEITVNGKIGALIALGAGFNPILTGRENIKISAAAMGYSQKQISDQMQEIINFSELGEFIDAPVQSYSSGMMARLGFSVAIHTMPEILLVDEVLAVGDLNFVIKCFKKIHDFKNKGGSIILVSHNIYSIRANCEKVVWVESGKVRAYGPTKEICDQYEDYVNSKLDIKGEEFFSGNIQLNSLVSNDLIETEDLNVKIDLTFKEPLENLIVTLSIFTLSGVNLTSSALKLKKVEQGQTEIDAVFKSLKISKGHFYINLVVAQDEIHNQLVAVVNRYKFRSEKEAKFVGEGLCAFECDWKY